MSPQHSPNKSLLVQVDAIARAAAKAILEVYQSKDFSVKFKSDRSPVTAADMASENVIRTGLEQLDEQFPIVSEEHEAVPFRERSTAKRIWVVDPLDGTKEFLKQTDEFCICIALIEAGRPVLGVIHAPVSGKSYLAASNEGAFVSSTLATLVRLSPKHKPSARNKSGLRFGVSRSHLSTATKEFIRTFDSPKLIPMGSALKFCALAEGALDVYPRFGPTMEWDTAAGDLIVKEAGGSLRAVGTDKPLLYNKSSLVNPSFVAIR